MSKPAAAPSTAEASEAPPAKKGGGLMALVKAIAFVSIVVILEVAAASVMFPSADETRAIGEKLAKGGHDEAHDEHADVEHGAADEHGGHGHGEQSRELSLGTYHIVAFNPKTRTTVSLDFELFGVVLAEEEHEFSEMFLVHEKRINEQVTIAVRGMDLADFTDPGLGLMKRVILEKTNRALGKPLVREIVVVGFSILSR